MILTENNTPSRRATARWRLMVDFGLSGAENMALDEALLDSVVAGGAPVIRFYTWDPPTLSLGVNQPAGEVDPVECARRGFGLVRRITGGRAVLHHQELTYSVIALDSDPLVSGGVIESYRKISAPLVEGLRSLGAGVTLSEPNRALFRAMANDRRYSDIAELEQTSHGAVCFDTASAYELAANGRKLVGSAQARRGGALLQHGSILLDVDWEAWASVFAYATERGRERALQKLPQRMTSLKEQLGREVTPGDVCDALTKSFAYHFNLDLDRSGTTSEERISAHRLAAEKYLNDTWTFRK